MNNHTHIQYIHSSHQRNSHSSGVEEGPGAPGSLIGCSFPQQPEPVPKAPEEPEEKPQVAEPEPPKDVRDTTSLHKSHLFDLNCKICTGKRQGSAGYIFSLTYLFVLMSGKILVGLSVSRGGLINGIIS